MGLVAAAHLSHLKGHAGSDLVEHVEAVVAHIGLEPRVPAFVQPEAVLEGMKHDKKKRRSRLRFVLLRDVGDPFIADDVEDSELLAVLDEIRDTESTRREVFEST
jgi:3-dehydroquinate synthase